METNNVQTFAQRNHHIIKLVFIFFIALFMMIPIAFVMDIIREREGLKSQTNMEISQSWGGSQVLTTPILIIPYKETLIDSEKKSYIVEKNLFVATEDVKISNKIDSEKRKRGIFTSIVYTNAQQLSGQFDLSKIPVEPNISYDFNKAMVQVGLTDPSSMASKVTMKWNGEPKEVQPGSKYKTTIENGFHIPVTINPEQKSYLFNLGYELRGSNNIGFILASKNADITMEADWPSPSFIGKNLPKSRKITADGFTAQWTTNEFNNNMLASWNDTELSISNREPIVMASLIETANDYQKNSRAGKYALFIMALSFATFFVFEFMHKKKIHPIQYSLVGLALAIFYLLLLSLSEHLGFNLAYLISASAVVAIITIYSRAIIAQLKSTLVLMGVLIFLYSYIFILLQLEDFALLAGSIGLFIILAGIMIASRKVNWYEQ